MFLYAVYKAIKAKLGASVPVFFYTGQYLNSKGKTVYRVPAIYIEMPKSHDIKFYGRKLLAGKGNVKIHYISHAPFKDADNSIQDSAIQAHENKVQEIDVLLNGWNAETNGQKLTEQLLPTGANMLNFLKDSVVSVVTYSTEFYSRHKQV